MVQIQSARDWLIQALDHIPKPLFFLDLDAKKVWFSNKAAQTMLGFKYEEGWSYEKAFANIKIFDPQGNELALEDYPSRRAIRGETIHGEQVTVETPKGRQTVRVFIDQMPAVHGQPRSAVILLQDITALKATEARLLRTQQELERAVEIAQIGFWTLDIKTSQITVTPLLMKQFGLDETNFDGTLDAAIAQIDPRDREHVQRAIENGVQRNQPYHIEYRCLSQSGGQRWIEAKGNVIRDELGQPTLFTGTTVDITDRKRAEEQMAQERFQLDQIFRDSPAAMATWLGQDHVFDRVNAEYQKIFPNRDLVGKPLLEAAPELRGQGFTEMLTRVLETGEAISGTEQVARIVGSDGETHDHFYNFSYVPLKDSEGKTYGVYDHAVDVTEAVVGRKELERARIAAEAANHTKSQFLANMSHEIRTPLGAIMGFASLLKDQTLPREQHESFVDVIERNSNQLLRIIDDILDLSKVEAGMLTVEHIDFSLPELLTDFSSLMGLKAREKGVGFSSRAVTPLPTIVNSDPTRLRQILMNIVGNALKFTDRGSVEIRCSYVDGKLAFEVEDSGRGISQEQMTHLFQPFSQADSSITRKYGGTGLGLVLTRSLAEALGGKFQLLRSEPEKGSVFRVDLKVEISESVDFVTGLGFQTVPPKSVAAIGELANMKILLVEDSPDNQALISIYLGRAGASTDIASDGAQGIQMAHSKDYDVVLMDVQMPVMDGLTAVKRLREAGYKKPVIALTAHAMREERIRCLQAGFDDFLSKPVTRKDLINLLMPRRASLS